MTRATAAFLVVLGTMAPTAVRGQATGPTVAQPGAPEAVRPPTAERTPPPRLEVAVDRTADGQPYLSLAVDLAGRVRPSIQIALVETGSADAKPLPLDGAAALATWQKQQESLGKPVHPQSAEVVQTATVFVEYDAGKLLRVRGRKNVLGKWASYGLDDASGRIVVIYLPEHWTDAQGIIRISLADLDAAAKFRRPGQLRIWVLEGEQVVADATASWPGIEAALVEKPAVEPSAAKPPAIGEWKAPEAKVEKAAGQSGPQPAQPKIEAPAAPALIAPPSPEKPPADQSPSGPAMTLPAPGNMPPAAVPTPPAAAEAPPAAKPAEPPAEPPAPPPAAALPPKPKSMEEMTIDELVTHIERTWGDLMNKEVRKNWQGGLHFYYKVQNPDTVRREIFMSLLRLCYKQQRPGDLRNAFAILYQHLKTAQGGR